MLKTEDEEKIEQIENKITWKGYMWPWFRHKQTYLVGIEKAFSKDAPPFPTGYKYFKGRVVTNPKEIREATFFFPFSSKNKKETKSDVKL